MGTRCAKGQATAGAAGDAAPARAGQYRPRRPRARLGELCRIAARLLSEAYAEAAPGARPGLILFVQTFGDLANFNPHVHVLAPDGAFLPDGTFVRLPPVKKARRLHAARPDVACKDDLRRGHRHRHLPLEDAPRAAREGRGPFPASGTFR